MSPIASTRFLILGPLQIGAGDGRRVALSGARQERLVAALLLDPHHRVSIDGLVEAVWTGAAPASGRRQVQDLVSRLRRALRDAGAADVVHTDGDGYLLTLEGHRFDAREFDLAVKAADAAAAGSDAGRADTDDSRPDVVAALRHGLALWRGPVLAGLHCPALSSTVAHWNERRIATWERCLATELQLHPEPGADLIEELHDLTRADPYREHPVQLLMTALHRGGRRTEALRTYREFRDRLVADLGLEPSEHLRRAHRLVLLDGTTRPGPSARPATPRPAQLPANIASFTGRIPYLSTLDTELTASGPPLIAVTGMAGVGKTALVVEWAHRTRNRFPDGQLFLDLRGFSDRDPVRPVEALRSFLHALGVPPDRVPAEETEASALYRSLLDGCRMLIVLDNAAGAEQVRPLLPGYRGCVTVVTSRRRLTGLVARDGARPVPLDAMTATEAHDLLTARLRHGRSAIDPDAVTDLAEHCDRLPLALVVVGARAAALPSAPLSAFITELRDIRSRQDALVADDGAADIWNVFSWSYRSLSSGAARTFRLLGLHPGADVAAPAVASQTGTDAAAAGTALSELVSAHLLADRGNGRYAFHSMMRSYARHLTLDRDPEPVRRAATIRLLDHYLHSAHPAAVVLNPHRRPITLPVIADGVNPERITERADALAWFAAERRALISTVRAASGRHDRHAWKLAWTLVTALGHERRYAELFAVQQVALESARRLGDAAMQAANHVCLGRLESRRGDFASARGHLERSAAIYRRLGDDAGLADTDVNLCTMLCRGGDTNAALPYAVRAVEEYRRAGHPVGEATALNVLGWCHAQLGRYTEARTYCERSLAMHRDLDAPYTLARTLETLGLIHRLVGRPAEAIRFYRRSGDIFASLGDRVHRAETLIELGRSHDAAGEPTAARDMWRDASAILEDVDHPAANEVRDLLRVRAHPAGAR